MALDKGAIDAMFDKVNSTKILTAETLTYKQLNVLVEVFEKLNELGIEENSREAIRNGINDMANQEANDIDMMPLTSDQRKAWEDYIKEQDEKEKKKLKLCKKYTGVL